MCGTYLQLFKKLTLLYFCLTALNVFAQDIPENTDLKKPEPAKAKTEIEKTLPAKKMVQDATINLQTTITGNQEQPRVLYILPWQSPTTSDVDFESLDNEQKAVFGHVEREELRRELESLGDIK